MHPALSLARLSGQPLLLRSDCHHLPHLLARSAAEPKSEQLSPTGPTGGLKPWEAREAVSLLPGGVAVVPCAGMLVAGLDPITAWYYDLCRPEALQAACAVLAERADVTKVVFNFDSPGGYTTQISETAEMIALLGQSKFTVAFTAGMMCSAAYWLGSQCLHVVATRSSTVGSVGTYATIYDYSGYLEKEGVVAHVVRAGTLKGIGAFGDKVTPEQLAFLQAGVDRINTGFLAAVAAGRGSARPLASADLQGQWFDGEEAQAKHLVDGLALNLPDLLDALTVAAA